MKKINLNNFPIFWIDFLDGKLSPDLENDLLNFLDNNPKIASDLFDPDNFVLKHKENIEDFDKENLKSYNINENLIIGKIENILDPEKQNYIDKEIQNNSDLKAEYNLYKLTKLRPNKKIKYPYKNSLKKGNAFFVNQKLISVVAASVIIVIVSYFSFNYFFSLNLPFYTNNQDLVSVSTKNLNNYKFIKEHKQPFKFTYLQEQHTTKTEPQLVNSAHETVKNKTTENQISFNILQKINTLNIKTIELNVANEQIPENFSALNNEEILYTIQIIKTPKQNKIKNTLNYLKDLTKKIDIAQEYEKLKIAKENLLSLK